MLKNTRVACIDFHFGNYLNSEGTNHLYQSNSTLDTFSTGLEDTFFPVTRYIVVCQRGFCKTSSFGLSR